MTQFNFNTTAEEVSDALAVAVQGKNVIVTGTSLGGLGAETARAIAKHASLVILTGRSVSKLEETIASIKEGNPTANLRALVLDLGSFDAVRTAAAEVNTYTEPIHVLINNAAIMAVPYALTIDGIESQFATNHLSHFLFTALIYPKLLAAATPSLPARVISVSSSVAVSDTPDIDFDDYTYSNGETYEIWLGYRMSKIANVLFAAELSRRAAKADGGPKVLAYSLHPGSIATNLQSALPPGGLQAARENYILKTGKPLPAMKTVHNGAATSVFAAFDPSLNDKAGVFLTDSQYSQEHQLAWMVGSENSAEKLWALSEKLTKAHFVI